MLNRLAQLSLVLSLSTLTIWATPVAVFGTGINLVSSVDQSWVITAIPAAEAGLATPNGIPGQYKAYKTDTTGFPFAYWDSTSVPSGASFISPRASYVDNSGDAPGFYDFTTSFLLDPSQNPAGAFLTFSLEVDNALVSVILNGNTFDGSTPSVFPSGVPSGYATFSGPYTITTGFVSGANTLTFRINNVDTGAVNFASSPAGLRVDISGDAATFKESISLPEPGTSALLGAGLLSISALFKRARKK